MIEYIIVLTGAFFFLVYYHMVIRPRKDYENCISEFEKKGFKVKKLGFVPFGAAFITNQKNDEVIFGDALKQHKEQFPGYDLTISNLLHYVRVQFINPQLNKQFFSVNHPDDYPKMDFVRDLLIRYVGGGLGVKEGEQWRKTRSLIGKVFNFDLIKAFIPTIQSLCQQGMDHIESLNPPDKDGFISFKINEIGTRIFSNVILEIFMGTKMRKQQIEGVPHYLYIQKTFTDGMNQGFQILSQLFGVGYLKLGIWESHRDINRRVQIVKGWASFFIEEQAKKIREKIKQGEINKESPKNVLQAIIFEHEDFSNKDLLEQFLILLNAGTDTSSLFLQMMVYYITRNPTIQQKLREQISCYMKNDDYSFENLKKFKYIDCILKETTRCYGPGVAIAPRQSNKDVFIAGVPIKKGTMLTKSDLPNHYNPEYFKKPQEFRPQRWEKQCDDLSPFVLGGFGGGVRTCIGKHLAMVQSKIALISLFKRYPTIICPKEHPKMTSHALYEPIDKIIFKVKINS